MVCFMVKSLKKTKYFEQFKTSGVGELEDQVKYTKIFDTWTLNYCHDLLFVDVNHTIQGSHPIKDTLLKFIFVYIHE